MKASRVVSATLSVLLVTVFSGAPDAFAQQAATDQVQVPQQSRGVSVDPSQPPLAPSSNAPLPDAPSAQQTPQTQQPSTTLSEQPTAQAPVQTQTPQSRQPLGAAAAEQVRTAGGGASRPAGAALAPAKQKQSRSLLIKTGAILAAGIAVGAIYGLTRATSSVPPNSGRK